MTEPATGAGGRLSVIIPTLDAAVGLARTLASVACADERLVVDGGSRDSTREIARAHGAAVVSAPVGRGVQLASGGQAATGDWLLFLHADTVMTPATWRAARDHMGAPGGPGRAAVFRFQLDDPAWQARLLEHGVAARVAMFGLPYGDQGLLIHRDLYASVGGYRPLPIMEDVDIVRRLGRRRLAPLRAPAPTSAARWRRRGWLRQSATNLACLMLFNLGVAPDRIARFYDR